MKVLIVDDEPLARRRLSRLLSRHDVEIVGEARDAAEAKVKIDALAPQLVLLDIDMPGTDGIAFARELGDEVAVVFTTAHAKHAVEAFAIAAIDYLLKPIEEERLVEALARVLAARGRAGGRTSPAATAAPAILRLAARSADAIELLDPARIARLHASDKYTLCRVGERELVLDESLNVLEGKLAGAGFFRVHRGELINLMRVRALRQDLEGVHVELDTGERAAVSRRMIAELKSRLGIT